MQHTRLAIFFGVSVVAGLITLVACDTDNATVPLPAGSSTSSGGSSSGGAGDDDTTGDDDDTTNPDADVLPDGGDAGVNCSTAPKLRKTDLGFFCAFYDGGTGDSGTGGRSNCGNGKVCCNPGKDGTTFPPTFCAEDTAVGNGQQSCDDGAGAAGSTWVATGSTTWECASSTNCGGKKCCATSLPGADAGNYINVGAASGTDAPPKACNAKFIYKIYGTRCADACKTDKSEIEMCSLTDGCSGGKTCVPVKAGRRDLGACQ